VSLKRCLIVLATLFTGTLMTIYIQCLYVLRENMILANYLICIGLRESRDPFGSPNIHRFHLSRSSQRNADEGSRLPIT